MRWGLIVLRGAVEPALVLVAGLLASYYLGTLAHLDSAGVTDLGVWSRRVGEAGLVGFFLLYGAFLWRLWRWTEGAGPSCQWCMGPLGRLRDGKVLYGRQLSDFRRCYNCGKANGYPE